MCGRFYIDLEDELYRRFLERMQQRDNQELPPFLGGEIFPTDFVPVLDETGLRAMQWGFARFDGKGKVINARSESALEKTMFRTSMLSSASGKDGALSGRCLIPATGYFEWETRDKKKIKYKLRPASEGMFTFAGLYRSEAGAKTPVFVILTAPTAEGILFIHDRMPLILPPEQRAEWLSDASAAAKLLKEGERDIEYEPAI